MNTNVVSFTDIIKDIKRKQDNVIHKHVIINGKIHDIYISTYPKLKIIEYCYNKKLHTEHNDIPAKVTYKLNNNIWKKTSTVFYKNGVPHRENGPAVIANDSMLYNSEISRINSVKCYKYYNNGIHHRLDGPAFFEEKNINGNISTEIYWSFKGKKIPFWCPKVNEGKIVVYKDQHETQLLEIKEIPPSLILKTILNFDREYGVYLSNL